MIHWDLLYTYPGSKVHWPTWGQPVDDRTHMGPMLAPWTLLSGYFTALLMWYGNACYHENTGIYGTRHPDPDPIYSATTHQPHDMKYLLPSPMAIWHIAVSRLRGVPEHTNAWYKGQLAYYFRKHIGSVQNDDYLICPNIINVWYTITQHTTCTNLHEIRQK